jgi:hypothetical protein
MDTNNNVPLVALKHHVTGAIERGEKQAIVEQKPQSKQKHVCLELFGGPEKFGIQLTQTGFDAFSVIYGKQVDTNLNYNRACAELGAAVLHWLCCANRADNQTPAEAKASGWTWTKRLKDLTHLPAPSRVQE